MSKFAGLFDRSTGAEKSKGKKKTPGEPPAASKKAPAKQKGGPSRGRPAGPAGGKRSNPEFTQTTAYIRKSTLSDVKVALIKEGQNRDYSELVEELLRKWLKSGE
jgi:hypothetical protein